MGGAPPRRRTLFSREAPPTVGRLRLKNAPGRRGLAVGAAVVALMVVAATVGVGLGWSKVRRPVPIEERMPQVGTDGDAAAGSAADGRSSSANSSDGGGRNSGSDDQKPAGAAEASKPTGGGPGSSDKIVVHIAGAVISPGVVTLGANSRVVDAVSAAGGLRPDADPDRVNLAEPLTDGVRIVVPAVGQDSVPEAVQLAGPSTGSSPSKGETATPAGPVNLNTATAADLEQLPGVGPATSAAIIAKREKDGPFRTVDSLLDVRGIGDAKLDAIRELVTVG